MSVREESVRVRLRVSRHVCVCVCVCGINTEQQRFNRGVYYVAVSPGCCASSAACILCVCISVSVITMERKEKLWYSSSACSSYNECTWSGLVVVVQNREGEKSETCSMM